MPSKEMFLEDEYLEPLGEAEFVGLLPRYGFKIVRAGKVLESLPPFADRVVITLKLNALSKGYIALPLQAEGYPLDDAPERFKGEKLLCPNGEVLKMRRSCFDIGGVPLFQLFANLNTTDEIVEFANKYGTLQGRMPVLLGLGGGVVFLESVSDWSREINLIRTALKLTEIYENRSWDRDLKVIAAGKFGASYNIEGTPFCVDGPPPPKAGMKEDVFRLLLVMFFNRQLREHQSYPGYGFDSRGHFTSAIYPTSLASAMWLQLAQSFFGDAPSERMAKRCFICGSFGSKANMRKRFKGEHRGRYYHIGCYETLKRRKHREKKAGMEGRSPKERQRKQFFVDSL